jgi:hypothetical protein
VDFSSALVSDSTKMHTRAPRSCVDDDFEEDEEEDDEDSYESDFVVQDDEPDVEELWTQPMDALPCLNRKPVSAPALVAIAVPGRSRLKRLQMDDDDDDDDDDKESRKENVIDVPSKRPKCVRV